MLFLGKPLWGPLTFFPSPLVKCSLSRRSHVLLLVNQISGIKEVYKTGARSQPWCPSSCSPFAHAGAQEHTDACLLSFLLCICPCGVISVFPENGFGRAGKRLEPGPARTWVAGPVKRPSSS